MNLTGRYRCIKEFDSLFGGGYTTPFGTPIGGLIDLIKVGDVVTIEPLDYLSTDTISMYQVNSILYPITPEQIPLHFEPEHKRFDEALDALLADE